MNIYNTIHDKLDNIKVHDSEMSPSLSLFSFDHKDIKQMGCDIYKHNNYCIQGVQGTETCKAIDETNREHDNLCKTLPQSSCSGVCVWRKSNLIDDNFEEFSEQPGACSRKCNKKNLREGHKCPIRNLRPQNYVDCKNDHNLLWCSNSNSGNSILGELRIKDIIGHNYNDLHTKYCSLTNDYTPYKNTNKIDTKFFNSIN
tara:strand:- start:152 stop:751 length:600 start_codon:yes stop_codon:yes gene_type:complete